MDAVGQTRERRSAALSFAAKFHNLRKRGFPADALRFHDETAAGVQRSAGDFVARRFFYWHGLAGHHRFINCARSFTDHAVDRNALTWTHAEPLTALHLIERNITFSPPGIQHVRLLRRQIQYRANRSA